MLITGVVIASDWQSIGHDPCLMVTPRTSNLSSTINSTNTSASLWSNKATLDGNYSSLPEDYFLSNDSVGEMLLKANYCMSQSSMENTCQWNPLSPITGKLCKECYPVCRSVHKSLNFIQLLIGIMLFTTAVPMSSVTLFLVASEFTPLEKQVRKTSYVLSLSKCSPCCTSIGMLRNHTGLINGRGFVNYVWFH